MVSITNSNTVTSTAQIKDGIVESADIKDNDIAAVDIGTNAVGADELADNAVDQAAIADDAVGLAEMKAGTAGNLISYDASGNPVAVATGTAGHILISNGAGAAPSFQENNAIPTKEFFVPFLSVGSGSAPYSAVNGYYTYVPLNDTGEARTWFKAPHDMVSLVSVEVIMIPDATETIQVDISTRFGAVGQGISEHTDGTDNSQLAVVVDKVTAMDITDNFTDLAAGDYATLWFQSDTNSLRVIGVKIKYA